ncbi:dihydropteroate synthase [Thermaerobacter subterraneus]|uniref:dihydropteroate synthase n=1 Tax=Thermaerobacter subterraneus TaxID=175696 RepID=UPI001FA76834|nr:dihydropteroate synthase [Thermaerobacter subterraneus]
MDQWRRALARARRGELAVLRQPWHRPVPGGTVAPYLVKVLCADEGRLAAWGTRYGLPARGICRHGSIPHYDLWGPLADRAWAELAPATLGTGPDAGPGENAEGAGPGAPPPGGSPFPHQGSSPSQGGTVLDHRNPERPAGIDSQAPGPAPAGGGPGPRAVVAVLRGPWPAGDAAARLVRAGWPGAGALYDRWQHVLEIAPLPPELARRLAHEAAGQTGFATWRPYAGAASLLLGGSLPQLWSLACRWGGHPAVPDPGRGPEPGGTTAGLGAPFTGRDQPASGEDLTRSAGHALARALLSLPHLPPGRLGAEGGAAPLSPAGVPAGSPVGGTAPAGRGRAGPVSAAPAAGAPWPAGGFPAGPVPLALGPRKVDFRGRSLLFGRRTLIMGVLNVTPDSFSDGGRYNAPDRALRRALEMVAEGADLIDVGAESANIAASKPELEEELARLVPVVERLVREVDVPISIDTYKAPVAEAALEAGAHIINDISGLHADPDLAAVCARYGAGVVIMHLQGHPRRLAREPRYDDVVLDVARYLAEGVQRALAAGVRPEAIVVDPGIGVGKRTRHNLEILENLGAFRSLGYPVLLGASRTSVIGNILETPIGDRLEGTLATTALAVVHGADMVRVHDVRANARVARMADALVRGWDEPAGGWPFDAVTGRQRRPLRELGRLPVRPGDQSRT